MLDADVARLSPYMRRDINIPRPLLVSPPPTSSASDGPYETPTHPTRIDETSNRDPRLRREQAIPCEVETNLVDLLVPARVLHEQGDLDAVVDV